MSHYTTKNIVIALLCSVTLHFMLAFAPNRTEHVLINNNQGTSQLKLTLAKQAIVVPPASTLIESEEAKQQIDKISEPSEPSQSTQNLVEPIISKSTSFNKTVSSPTLEKEETKIPPPKDAGVTETTKKGCLYLMSRLNPWQWTTVLKVPTVILKFLLRVWIAI